MKIRPNSIRVVMYVNMFIYISMLLLFGTYNQNSIVWFFFNSYDVVAYWIIGLLSFSVAFWACPPIQEKKAWELIGLGMFSYGLGDLLWALSISSTPFIPIGVIQDILYICASIIWTTGIIVLFSSEFPAKVVEKANKKYLIIADIVFVVLLLVSGTFFYFTGMQTYTYGIYDMIQNGLYVVVDLILVSFAIKGLLLSKELRLNQLRKMWTMFLLAGILLYVFDTLFMSLLSFFTEYAMTTAYMWIFPAMLMGLAMAEYLDALKFIPPHVSELR